MEIPQKPLLIIFDIGHTIIEKKGITKQENRKLIGEAVNNACVKGGLLAQDGSENDKFQHHFHDLYNQLVVQVLDDYQFTKDKMIHEYAHYALSNIGYDHEEEKVKNIMDEHL